MPKTRRRPRTVAAAGWFITISGMLSALTLALTYEYPETQWLLKSAGGISLAWMMSSILLNIVSGIAILKGLNWGRLLYLWTVGISMLIDWKLSGFDIMDMTGLVTYSIFLTILIRPQALAFFKNHGREEASA